MLAESQIKVNEKEDRTHWANTGTGEMPGDTVFLDTWTKEEEKELVRKLDGTVLAILTLCFFFFQLDRANIGNALTDKFLDDVGITQDWFNVGQQLLNAGIVLLEGISILISLAYVKLASQIPSNLILYRIGPKHWIGGQIIAWGLVATFQAFQNDLGAFMATRLLLGLLEAGFIPGSLYTLSLWYKSSELSRRFGFFFLGNGIAQACGGLIAYGILQMRGVGGLAGWQWLFLIEGILSLLSGVLFICLFPGDPYNPVSIAKVSYFSEREIMILRSRLLQNSSGTQTTTSRHITGTSILQTLGNPKVWPHVILTIVGLAPTTALWSYAPTIIGSLGYDRLGANAMASVGQWISIFLIIVAAFIADKTGRRGFVVLFGVTCEWTFMVAFKCLPDTASAGVKYGILTMGTATCSWWHSVNGSWLSINARSPEERSIRMAMFIMAANCAGIVGAQLFRSDDKPFYHRGWTIITALMSLGMALVITLLAMYYNSNRRMKKTKAEDGFGTSNQIQLDNF